jgi:hypothetical protein
MTDNERGQIKQSIRLAIINQQIDFSWVKEFCLEDVTFCFSPNYGFYWHGSRKNSPLDAYPMKSPTLIKHFKTLENAKRNFVKRFLEKDQ